MVTPRSRQMYKFMFIAVSKQHCVVDCQTSGYATCSDNGLRHRPPGCERCGCPRDAEQSSHCQACDPKRQRSDADQRSGDKKRSEDTEMDGKKNENDVIESAVAPTVHEGGDAKHAPQTGQQQQPQQSQRKKPQEQQVGEHENLQSRPSMAAQKSDSVQEKEISNTHQLSNRSAASIQIGVEQEVSTCLNASQVTSTATAQRQSDSRQGVEFDQLAGMTEQMLLKNPDEAILFLQQQLQKLTCQAPPKDVTEAKFPGYEKQPMSSDLREDAVLQRTEGAHAPEQVPEPQMSTMSANTEIKCTDLDSSKNSNQNERYYNPEQQTEESKNSRDTEVSSPEDIPAHEKPSTDTARSTTCKDEAAVNEKSAQCTDKSQLTHESDRPRVQQEVNGNSANNSVGKNASRQASQTGDTERVKNQSGGRNVDTGSNKTEAAGDHHQLTNAHQRSKEATSCPQTGPPEHGSQKKLLQVSDNKNTDVVRDHNTGEPSSVNVTDSESSGSITEHSLTEKKGGGKRNTNGLTESGKQDNKAHNTNSKNATRGASTEGDKGGTYYRKSGQESDATMKPKKETKKNKQNKGGTGQHGRGRSRQDTLRRNEDMMKVIFTVLVSPDFNYDPAKHKVIIKGKEPVFGKKGWDEPNGAVVLEPVSEPGKDLPKKFVKVEGVLEVPWRLLVNKHIQYKYGILVQENKKWMWEHLPKRRFDHREHEDRILTVPEAYCVPDGIWNRYDDVVYPGYGSNFFDRMKHTFLSHWNDQETKRLKEKQKAVVCNLSKWEGFYTGECATKGMAIDAIENVEQVEMAVRENWTSGFNVQEVFQEYLSAKLSSFAKYKAKQDDDEDKGVLRLASSLAITYLIHRYDLYNHLKRQQLDNLFHALLVQPNFKKRQCLDYEGLEHHFPNSRIRRDVAAAVADLCNRSMGCEDLNPKWIFSMPILHFLMGVSRPFEPVNYDVVDNTTSSAWWGVEGLNYNEFIKNAKYKRVSMEPLIEELAPIFNVDHLLPRTCARVVGLDAFCKLTEKHHFPIPLICIVIKTSMYSSNVKTVVCLIRHIEQQTKRLETSASPDTDDVMPKSADLLSEIGGVVQFSWILVDEISKRCHTSYRDVFYLAVAVFVSCCNLYTKVLREAISGQERTLTVQKIRVFGQKTKLLENAVLSWLNKTLPTYLLNFTHSGYVSLCYHKELQVWTDFLRIEFDAVEDNESWQDALLHMFTKRVNEINVEQKVELFCHQSVTSECHQKIFDVIGEAALKAVEQLCERGQGVKVFGPLKDAHNSNRRKHPDRAYRYGILLSNLLNKSWPKSKTGESQLECSELLRHILTWPPFASFVKMTEFEHGYGDILDDVAQQNLSIALSLTHSLLTEIMEGSVSFRNMELVLTNQRQFLELCDITERAAPVEYPATDVKHPTLSTSKNQMISTLLRYRQGELLEFHKEKKLVACLVEQCRLIDPGSAVPLDNKLEASIESASWNTICEPFTPFNQQSMPRITYFGLPPCVKMMMLLLPNIDSSYVFRKQWTEIGKRFLKKKGDHITITEIASEVWPNVQRYITEVTTKMENGDITLGQVDEIFEIYRGRYGELRKELIKLSGQGSKEWIAARVDQVEQYYELDRRLAAVDIILKVKDMLGLTGNFHTIDTLRSLKEGDIKQKPLNSMNDQVMNASTRLSNIAPREVSCLEGMLKCGDLIEWLRSEIENVQQLKVFVDLAMISAGETPMEVDRVKWLHQATTGYAPLIFDLDVNADFDQLLDSCDSLWNALRNDETLPDKLISISRHIEWIKGVKQSHGSVEMSSLSQAEAINSRGIYTVGCLGKKVAKDSIDAVVTLLVPAVEQIPLDSTSDSSMKNEKESDKEYTLEMLRDLQSKLMLVAGKAEQGKGEVDKFTEILSGVMRLAHTYIDLYSTGNVLFSEWKVFIYCEPGKKVSVIVDVGIDGCDFKGTEQIERQLSSLCDFLEKCLEEWKIYVEEKQEQHYYLNFFTTKQLVMLRKELARAVMSIDEMSPGIYTLLGTLKQDCCADDVRQAVKKTFIERSDDDMLLHSKEDPCNATFEDATEVGKGDPDVGNSEDMRRVKKLQILLKFLEEEGISEMVAKAAVVSCGIEADMDDALAWCFQNMNNQELVSQLNETWNEQIQNWNISGTRGVIYPALPPAPTVEDSSSNTMIPEVSKADVQPRYEQMSSLDAIIPLILELESKDEDLIINLDHLCRKFQESVTTKSVQEYLSLEHLGKILQIIAEKGDSKASRQRPICLNEGKPTLVVRPTGEILNTVLSFYMTDTNTPLPSYDEVLLCTQQTTLEEVVLLWRRAMYDTSGGIYCLVNADRLDYEVSTKAEDKRLKMEKHAVKNYSLVVLCSREREDYCHLVTALDPYRIDPPTLPIMTSVKAYMREQFIRQTLQVQSSEVAGRLIHDRCCVQVVMSSRAGVGKSLAVARLTEELQQITGNIEDVCVTVPLTEKSVDQNVIVSKLTEYITAPTNPVPRIFHFDITPAVLQGVDDFLFNLLILGSINNSHGHVWRRNPWDLYIIEMTSSLQLASHSVDTSRQDEIVRPSSTELHHLLPGITCKSPKQILDLEMQKLQDSIPDEFKQDPLMDQREFESDSYQRAYQYLVRHSRGENLDNFTYKEAQVEGDPVQCLGVLLRHCGVADPSWAELRNFVWFLNEQLKDCENSSFCDASHLGDTGLNGFLNFVVRFMMQMSKDFATPSLNISEQGPAKFDDVAQFQLRRRWENSPHPYIFFNHDHHTMTFLGFYIDDNGSLVDPSSNDILEQNLMSRDLRGGLTLQRVNLREDFDAQPRDRKIVQLCQVMGIDWPHDPDETYELTTDNVKKILAIHMRFRCGIPVIVMGETGCGKTRLVRFMCQLQAGISGSDGPKNMILMKVHGGTTAGDITKKVRKAEKLARKNKDKHNVDTVLFFDEANTTEAIGLIKEVMCDRRMNGKQLTQGTNPLKIVAACNPYRRHTTEMINRLEEAGLGYHIKAEETDDKLGRIPLRQLVYRVQALPPSMLPLVWDFGQLSNDVEELYIKQIAERYIQSNKIPADGREMITSVLAESQRFMRERKNECSFVSLRDVERAMNVLVWFYNHDEILEMVIARGKKDYQKNKARNDDDDDDDDDSFFHESDEGDKYKPLHPLTLAMVLSLGVCYHACLQEERESYRNRVAQKFCPPCNLPNGADRMLDEIARCQDVFLDELDLGANIARNAALKENVFMMVVCIELRIPLFLVGKPGSSKSLAKTIVADAMQGEAAASSLYKTFKQIHMVSYQCSPLSTPEGIVGTFRQCSRFQEDKDLDRFVSVVVLDEVGLAEDSPKMPLKTLHPLLEYGCDEDDNPPPHKKVAFIGISNWALDPAKMNRGILVSRGIPNEKELIDSAKGICSSDKLVSPNIDHLLPALAKGYRKLCDEQSREFFGLRDFYSLIKMVYGFSKASNDPPTWRQLEHAIRRNFDGLEGMDPMKNFDELSNHFAMDEPKSANDPDCNPSDLIRASLHGLPENILKMDSEGRYLLILTENYAALGILQQQLLKEGNVIIFGSSFPKDLEYTQVCRNINRIKVCMETGRTVVLLNLENLYESLYDALNQYYVYFGGQRYVDLGLGTHRVKCRVHKDFRLIVVADKDDVRQRFPIPLINRLEKHFLAMSTMLTDDELEVVKRLEKWTKAFATVSSTSRSHTAFKVQDVFIGFNNDTIASIVLQVCLKMGQHKADEGIENWHDEVFEQSKDILLQSSTPDAVARLTETGLCSKAEWIWNKYFQEQKHESLAQYLQFQVNLAEQRGKHEGILAQVTTHSTLLSRRDINDVASTIRPGFKSFMIQTLYLQEFQTEQQFTRKVREFFKDSGRSQERMLIVQCESGNENNNLIACSRYIVHDERDDAMKQAEKEAWPPAHIVYIIQLPRTSGGTFDGLQGGEWMCVHIDDLRPPQTNRPEITSLQSQPVSMIFESDIQSVRAKTGHDTNNGGISVMEVDSGVLEDLLHKEQDEMDVKCGFVRQPCENGVLRETVFENLNPDEYSHGTDYVDTSTDIPFAVDLARNGSHLTEELLRSDNWSKRTVQRDQTGIEDHSHSKKALLDTDALLKSCIQASSAVLENDENRTHRSTQRIDILLKLFRDSKDSSSCESKVSFVDVLKERIYLLLKERDERVGHMASEWLTKEALSGEKVQIHGTFRKAVWQSLVGIVTPLLAAVIAFSDRNDNLDLITRSSPSNWVHRLWLDILRHRRISNISYEAIVSQLKKEQRQTIPVRGYSFTTQCPFSQLITEHVHAVWSNALEMSASTHQSVNDCFRNLWDASDIGLTLNQSLRTQEEQAEFMEKYLNDFISIVFKVQKEKIIQDVIHGIQVVARQQHESHQFVFNIPTMLVAYHKVRVRLENFCSIVRILTESDVIFGSFRRDNSMILDNLALRALLESLHIKKDQLNDTAARLLWLKRVHHAKQVVERVFDSEKEDVDAAMYDEISRTIIQKCRPLWVRICVVKMFVDHVCPLNTKDGNENIKKCNFLFKALGEDLDLKSLKSMETVENFLRHCNERASRQHFCHGVYKCGWCEKAIQEPVALPCQHVLCEKCVIEYFKISRKRTCPTCSKDVPEGFEIKSTIESLQAIQEHDAFRKRCNSFFMDLVSRYCFSEGEPPEPELVAKLMGYVTRLKKGTDLKTKRFTPFEEDCIDPNPVVRSFLLKLLLRSSVNEAVFKHLEDHLAQAKTFLKTPQENIEFLAICIQCIEDFHHNQVLQSGTEPHLALVKGAVKSLDLAVNECGQPTSGIDVAQMVAVAHARFGLVVTAEQIRVFYGGPHQQNEKQQQSQPEVFRESKKLFAMAKRLSESTENEWPNIFLLKQLCRRYGTMCLKSAVEHLDLQWIMPSEGHSKTNILPDHFILCDSKYEHLREAMSQSLLEGDMKSVESVLEVFKGEGELTEVLLMLAMYRQITMRHADNIDGGQRMDIDPETVQMLVDFIKNSGHIQRKDFAELLITNKQGGKCSELKVTSDQPPSHHLLSTVVIHALIVFECCKQSPMAKPLVSLMADPHAMNNSYLPTMPEDLIMEARQAITEKVRWYECPNGHPYTIGECGNPAMVYKCKDCNAPIGGKDAKQLERGNKPARMEDTTQTGHILGPPENRQDEKPVPERDMSPAANAIIRLLTNAAMLGGSTKSPEAVAPLINPSIIATEVPSFLWRHIERDVHLLTQACGKSVDDSYLIIHMILQEILKQTPQDQSQHRQDFLNTKESRSAWESAFTKAYIDPVIEGITGKLQKANSAIHNDNRLGTNRLDRLLYEVDQETYNEPIKSLYDVASVWRYRSKITIAHLTQFLDESSYAVHKKEKCKVLKEFLNKERMLRAVKYLPDIIHLQQLLIEKYHRNIDEHEARNIKLKHFLKGLPDVNTRKRFEKLLRSFRTAWDYVRSDIATDASRGGLLVPKESCNQVIHENTSLGMILPTRKGDGICSTALVEFLINIQNEFLEKYTTITEGPEPEEVQPCDLTTADLIAYDPEKDLLPMVLSHCNYSLQVGRGTLVEYDLPALERQVEDRFINGKAKIVRKVEQLVFREDSRDSAVFESLKTKLPQEPLSKAIQRQIISELRSLPEVSDSLACLDIAIGFLASCGGKPGQLIKKYLIDTLKMDGDEMKDTIHVKQPCPLKNVLSLWKLLAAEKAKRLTLNLQDPFNGMYEFNDELTPEQIQDLHTALRYLDVDSLVIELHHYIAIGLRKRQNTEGVSEWGLRDTLSAEREAAGDYVIHGFEEHFPSSISIKHIRSTWKEIVQYQHKDVKRHGF